VGRGRRRTPPASPCSRRRVRLSGPQAGGPLPSGRAEFPTHSFHGPEEPRDDGDPRTPLTLDAPAPGGRGTASTAACPPPARSTGPSRRRPPRARRRTRGTGKTTTLPEPFALPRATAAFPAEDGHPARCPVPGTG